MVTHGEDRSAAEHLARITGSSVGAARDTIAVGAALNERPELNEAARQGAISPDQASLLADTLNASPKDEKRLVDEAKSKKKSLKNLKDECRRTKRAADPTPEDTRNRIHRERRMRTWTDREGAWNLSARGTVEAGAEIMSVINPYIEAIFNRARTTDKRESRDNYAFDALFATCPRRRQRHPYRQR